MLDVMIDETGRRIIGALVTYELGRLGLHRGRIKKEWTRVSPATVDRIRRAEPVGDQYLAAIGDLLSMPRGYLQYVGAGDVERIKNSGADADLIRWTLDLIKHEHDRSTAGMNGNGA